MMNTDSDRKKERDLERTLDAVEKLRRLEVQIPNCKTIDEVSDIKLWSMAIQTYGREHGTESLGCGIVDWAKRVAVKCEIQITKLQEARLAKKNGGSESPTVGLSPKPPDQRRKESNARILGSIPEDELDRLLDDQMANGGIKPRKLAEELRGKRKKAPPKSTPEQLAGARARYYRNKDAKEAAKPKRSVMSRFEESFWPKVEKLLLSVFNVEELGRIEARFSEKFQQFRMEAEKNRQERKNAFANLKKPPGKVGAIPGDE